MPKEPTVKTRTEWKLFTLHPFFIGQSQECRTSRSTNTVLVSNIYTKYTVITVIYRHLVLKYYSKTIIFTTFIYL
jgi:hypothetical protein